MIIIRIIGGLGNQIFQYSLYKKLEENGFEVKADLSDFGKTGLTFHNGYELNRIFDIKLHIATANEIKRVKNSKSTGYYFRKLKKILFNRRLPHLREGNFPKEWLIEKLAKLNERDYYLDGYWQSEDFFVEINNSLRKDLKFKDFSNSKNLEVAKKMRDSNSVSVHIRGGDYISTPELFELYGCVCDQSYYNRAISHIQERVNDPTFFIFSNDFNWVNKNIDIAANAEKISWNEGEDSFRDMQLMSICKNRIIANSSFSWWADWFSDSEGITIAPSKWTGKDENRDIYRSSWTRL